jgi:hypothetical protein
MVDLATMDEQERAELQKKLAKRKAKNGARSISGKRGADWPTTVKPSIFRTETLSSTVVQIRGRGRGAKSARRSSACTSRPTGDHGGCPRRASRPGQHDAGGRSARSEGARRADDLGIAGDSGRKLDTRAADGKCTADGRMRAVLEPTILTDVRETA